MTVVRLVLSAEIEIDLEAWAAAALEAEHADRLYTHPEDIIYHAVGLFPIEDNVPRWARDSINVTSETYSVLEGDS